MREQGKEKIMGFKVIVDAEGFLATIVTRKKEQTLIESYALKLSPHEQ